MRFDECIKDIRFEGVVQVWSKPFTSYQQQKWQGVCLRADSVYVHMPCEKKYNADKLYGLFKITRNMSPFTPS